MNKNDIKTKKVIKDIKEKNNHNNIKHYIKDKTSSSPIIEQKASAMFANTLPTNVNAERICVENTLIVPQILYWLGISVPSTLDGYVFINNYALSEEWREEVDTE